MTINNKKIINVVGAVIKNERNEILCTLRNKDKDLGNYWEFPGGKIEPNETKEKAIEREIKEELDLVVKSKEILMETICERENFIINLTCFECDIIAGKLTLNEHEAYLWLKPESLLSLVWVPADIPIVKHLIESYKN
jgi:8-oxo-dGTP diphosphatase